MTYNYFRVSAIALLLLSIALTACFIYAIVLPCCPCRGRRENQRYDAYSRRPVVRVGGAPLIAPRPVYIPPTTPVEEENIPLTPPPPAYTPSSDLVENDGLLVTPPPPYVPSSASTENENTPLTAPPPYIESSV